MNGKKQKQTEKITLLKTTGMALVSAGTFYSKRGVVDTTLCNEVCYWLAAGQWFSAGSPFSSTNKSDNHDIT